MLPSYSKLEKALQYFASEVFSRPGYSPGLRQDVLVLGLIQYAGEFTDFHAAGGCAYVSAGLLSRCTAWTVFENIFDCCCLYLKRIPKGS